MKGRFLHPLLFLLLLVCCFSLAVLLQPSAEAIAQASGEGSILKVMLGDGRKMFADLLFREADVTLHSGYYPSMFFQPQAPTNSEHMTIGEGGDEEAEEAHEKSMASAFMGPPKDWIEAFGRHFLITNHTHLGGGGERELLPWFKFSAELDPHRIDTYTVAAYFLRGPSLNKVAEAEQFLRDGLRQNPDSYEILFDLGRIYLENYTNTDRARRVWELAKAGWGRAWDAGKGPETNDLYKITLNLGRLEEQTGNLRPAIKYLEEAQQYSPNPGVLKKQIDELQQKLDNARR